MPKKCQDMAADDSSARLKLLCIKVGGEGVCVCVCGSGVGGLAVELHFCIILGLQNNKMP